MNRQSIAMRIRNQRQRAGMTQRQLADLIGREQSEISRIENGKTALSVDLLLTIARVLGVSAASFIEESNREIA